MGADLRPARPTPAPTPAAQNDGVKETGWTARSIEWVGYGVSGILPLGRVLAGGASGQFPRPGLTRRGLFLSTFLYPPQRTVSQQHVLERNVHELW